MQKEETLKGQTRQMGEAKRNTAAVGLARAERERNRKNLFIAQIFSTIKVFGIRDP